MNGKERVMTALELGQPDTVPIWELAFSEASIIKIARNFMDASQLPETKFYGDMSEMEMFQLANGLLTFARELDLDGLSAITSAPIERVDDKHVRDANGVVLRISDFGEPYPVSGPINDADDLKSFKLRPPLDPDFMQIDILRATFPQKAVSYMLSGPFYISWGLRGSMENLLMDYAMNPGLALDLARMATDYCLEAVEKIAAKGADFIVMECDLAYKGGTLMSPAHYEKFIGPFHREIVDAAHKKNLKVVKHTDGKVNSLIPNFIEDGFDAFHPIQPQCMDIAAMKREYGDRLCLMGNIDCAFLLVDGDPAQVRESVRDTIAVAGPGGGYIMSSSNTIHPGCRAENYIAMVEAAREFGSYE